MCFKFANYLISFHKYQVNVLHEKYVTKAVLHLLKENEDQIFDYVLQISCLF